MTDKLDWKIICFGLGCITALEALALLLGYNGTILKTVLIVIALAIGITIPSDKFIK